MAAAAGEQSSESSASARQVIGRSLSEPDAPAPTPRGRAYRAARSVNRAPQGRLKSARRSHEASIRTSGRAARRRTARAARHGNSLLTRDGGIDADPGEGNSPSECEPMRLTITSPARIEGPRLSQAPNGPIIGPPLERRSRPWRAPRGPGRAAHSFKGGERKQSASSWVVGSLEGLPTQPRQTSRAMDRSLRTTGASSGPSSPLPVSATASDGRRQRRP